MSPISRRLINRVKSAFCAFFIFHYFVFISRRKRSTNSFACTFEGVYKRSIILEYFSRVFYIFTRIFLYLIHNFLPCQDVFRVNYSGKKGKRNLRDTIRRSLVLICFSCRLDRLFSPVERDRKTIGQHASRGCTLLPVDNMRPPSELSSSEPIVGPCRLRLVVAHLPMFLLAFLAMYLLRIHKRLMVNVHKQCWWNQYKPTVHTNLHRQR